MADITRQFQAQGLSAADYSIVHRIGSHRFTMVDGDVAEHAVRGASPDRGDLRASADA